MIGEHLESILKNAQAKTEKDGFSVLPDGATLTLYAGHDGVPLNVPRVDAIKVDGDLVYARTARRETFALHRGDLFAVALEGAVGQPARRAGFG